MFGHSRDVAFAQGLAHSVPAGARPHEQVGQRHPLAAADHVDPHRPRCAVSQTRDDLGRFRIAMHPFGKEVLRAAGQDEHGPAPTLQPADERVDAAVAGEDGDQRVARPFQLGGGGDVLLGKGQGTGDGETLRFELGAQRIGGARVIAPAMLVGHEPDVPQCRFHALTMFKVGRAFPVGPLLRLGTAPQILRLRMSQPVTRLKML